MSQDRVRISNDHPALNSMLVRPPSGDVVRGPIGHDEAIAIMVILRCVDALTILHVFAFCIHANDYCS